MFLDRQFQMPGTVFQVGTLEVAKERDANLIVMGVRRAVSCNNSPPRRLG